MDKTTNKKKEMENKKEKQAAVGYKRKKKERMRDPGVRFLAAFLPQLWVKECTNSRLGNERRNWKSRRQTLTVWTEERRHKQGNDRSEDREQRSEEEVGRK